MNLAKLTVLSRKIHRLCYYFMATLGLTMMITGLVNLYPRILWFIDPSLALRLHVLVAPYFALVLFVMIVTGSMMFFYPKLQRYFRKPPEPTNQ